MPLLVPPSTSPCRVCDQPITPSGTLDIGVNLTINGLGPTETVVSGNNAVTVFDVAVA